MRFLPGQEVEIASKEEGFLGSYYAAIIVTYIENEFYLVQYKELLKEDESGPLREVVQGVDIRPTPPAKSFPMAAGFTVLDRVDALYNDGWWTGMITGKEGSRFVVHFEDSGEELAFSDSEMRMHLEWINRNWIATTRRRILLPQKDS
ncbi:protein AGENET DOMAIN (AGD)-CONTAINING P1-like [Rhodamnia argentea]|uniref:Protein AGENET DOMAIN (AGD)-CONTAINING P1-like n=1 Tax=Rhodamnia argentea TaxID=178133 RepID=A0A8B8PPR1_9MYRT|nr:protein AGENET DOMAIN (AGD)-CONTAINING P1-like [Rhodamnia argentea]